MKTVILATDFSEAAFNAAQYAASLTRQIPVERLVLYHSYYSMIATDTPPTDIELGSILREDSIRKLNEMKSYLIPLAQAGITIDCLADMFPFQEAVSVNFLKEKADLVVMGITGKSKIKERIMGSQAVMAAKRTTIPLLLIPFDATYKKIKKVVFAWDMMDSERTFPRKMLKDALQILNAELLVLNVDHNNKSFDEDTIREQKFMHQILEAEDAKFFYGNHPDAARGIIDFAERQQADLVMVIPRKKAFPENLFKKRITKRLAFNIKIPLFILPEDKNQAQD